MAAAARPLATQIVGSARRALAMVGELLDSTRSRLGGGIPCVRAAGDLLALVRETAAEVAAAQPGGVIVVRTPGHAEGALLPSRFDGARLGRAVSNLVGNTAEHGDAGPVTLTLGTATADAVVAGPVATIAVHNRGPAMAAAQLDGLFIPLPPRAARPARTDHGPTSGLGLGLYIAERIVHAHGGRLTVTSAEGLGTTFTATLPHD